MWWILGARAAIVPASEVAFDVAVSGSIAEIEVRQSFRNDSPHRVDATYRFPLHDDAVVDGMQIRLEDRTIDGVIEEKEEARRRYEEAVAQGKTAALTETERWNVYRQQVGNIPPGAELEVILRIVQPVDRMGRTFELSLPVGNAGAFEPDSPAVPADIAMEIDAGLPLTNVDCVTHQAFEAPTGQGWTVLVADADPALGPVVVRWELADPHAQIGAVYDERHLMLVFEPPVHASDRRPREVVVLGEPQFAGLVRSVAQALQNGDPVRALPTADVPGELRRQAAMPATEGTARYLVVVSDAGWNDSEALLDELIDSEHPIFTVAASPLANRFVLDELAERTGARTFSAPLDLPAIARLLDRPTLSAIEVDWGDWGEAELAGAIPDVHLGDPVEVLARTTYADGGPVEVSGIVGDERLSWRVEPRAVAQGRALGSTWARARIETLGRQQVRTGVSARDEGLPLALDYGILSPWTAFVAIDPRPHAAERLQDEDRVESGEALEREAPSTVTEDETISFDDDPERTVIDFSDMDVRGELVKPDGALLLPPVPEERRREYRAAPTSKSKKPKVVDAEKRSVPTAGTQAASADAGEGTGFRMGPRPSSTRRLEDGTVIYARSTPELRPMHPPPARGAIGLGGYAGSDTFGIRGGYDRSRIEDGVWRQVPVVLDLSAREVHGRLGYRYQQLTVPDRTQTDRRRHAVDLGVSGTWDGGWYGIRGLGQSLTCERCDPSRAFALAAEGGAHFGDDALQGRIGLRGALSDFRGQGGVTGGRTAFALTPVLGLSYTLRRFRAVLDVAPAVGNPDGLRFVPTATAELGPRFGAWHLQVGGGQRSNLDRPVWGVPIERRGWVGVGYGDERPWATLRGGIDQSLGPYAVPLEQLEALPSRDWRRTALFGELAVRRSAERWHVGWLARVTGVLRSDENLTSPTAPYVPGLLVAHRPFYTAGQLGVSAQRTHVNLRAGLASPLAVRGWWGRWQAHGSLGAVQEVGGAGRIGLGAVIEAWSGRPGDVDPSRPDGWIAPERAGVWAGRLELTLRLI